MAFLPAWHPLLPSSAAHGVHPVAARAAGQDLVAWRSAAGVGQVWKDRCPHRGVRLSLGRIVHDRLACAYHGWEYAADSGRCAAIPAQPGASVPGRVSAAPFPTRDSQGMLWVHLDAAQPASTLPPPLLHDGPAQPRFCQSLAVEHPHPEALAHALARHGTLEHPQAWQGRLAGHAVHAFVLQADTHWSVLHLWCADTPSSDGLRAVMAAARRLRSDIEAGTA